MGNASCTCAQEDKADDAQSPSAVIADAMREETLEEDPAEEPMMEKISTVERQSIYQIATPKRLLNVSAKPVPLILVSDPGQDLDDEMAFAMLRYLVELNLADVRGVVTTLSPSFDRARLCRGTLDVLGLFGVPIGVGSDGGDMAGKHKASTFLEWAQTYMPPRYSAASDTFQPGRLLLERLYKKAARKSLTLVIIAAMKDPAIFLRDDPELFKEKTREVVIMGGVENCFEPQTDDEPTVLKPDTANNNTFDMEAARFFYQQCQELGIPLVIVSRWSAYAAKLPRSCYDALASTGSWIGCRLRNAQRSSIESLWARAASPPGSADRLHLPDRCDRTWFLKTFCGGESASDREAGDTIWDLVRGFMQYDTIAVMAAIPSLREEYFEPDIVTGLHGAQHLIIGRTEAEPNVSDTKGLVQFLNTGFRHGLALNHNRKIQIILLLQPRWSNRAENLAALVAFRTLFEMGIFDCAGIIVSLPPEKPLRGPKKSSSLLSRSESKTMGATQTLTRQKSSLTMSFADGMDIAGKGHKEGSVQAVGSEMASFLSLLGLSHVPVLVDDPDGTTGEQHLAELYSTASPAGVTLVATGTVDILADFVESDSKSFHQKTQRVILMSAAFQAPELDDAGDDTGHVTLQPDSASQNNQLDMHSAKRFFRLAQKLLVPLVVVSRHFAQALQLPRSFFDILGNHSYGGEVGKVLYDVQRQGVVELWHAVCASPNDESARRDLPSRCDRDWFVKSFCGGIAPASDSDDDVWKSLDFFNVYNLQAIILALPPVFNRFVVDSSVTVRSVTHHLVGPSSDEPGVVDSIELRGFILQCILLGTRLNSSVFDFQSPPPIQLLKDCAETMWNYNEDKQILEWLQPPERKEGYNAFERLSGLLHDNWTVE